MKKRYIIIGIVVVLLIVLSIVLFKMFHYDVITCKDNIKGDNYTVLYTYKIYHRKDIVKKVLITEEVKSKNNTVLSFFEKNYKDEFDKYNKEYGGYTIDSKVNTNKNNMIINIKLDLDKVDMKKLNQGRSYLKKDIKKNKLYVDGVYKLFNINSKV